MKRTIAILSTCIFISQISFANSFQIVGNRALGMGGAHVAVAEGPSAQYWNPGALGVTTGSGVQIPFGLSAEATGDVLQKADDIQKFADKIDTLQSKQKNGGTIDLQEVKDFNEAGTKILALNDVGTGFLVDSYGGLETRLGKLALSFNQYGDAGVRPFVDPSF